MELSPVYQMRLTEVAPVQTPTPTQSKHNKNRGLNYNYLEFPYVNAVINDNIYKSIACLVFQVIVITRKIMVSLILRDLKSF